MKKQTQQQILKEYFISSSRSRFAIENCVHDKFDIVAILDQHRSYIFRWPTYKTNSLVFLNKTQNKQKIENRNCVQVVSTIWAIASLGTSIVFAAFFSVFFVFDFFSFVVAVVVVVDFWSTTATVFVVVVDDEGFSPLTIGVGSIAFENVRFLLLSHQTRKMRSFCFFWLPVHNRYRLRQLRQQQRSIDSSFINKVGMIEENKHNLKCTWESTGLVGDNADDEMTNTRYSNQPRIWIKKKWNIAQQKANLAKFEIVDAKRGILRQRCQLFVFILIVTVKLSEKNQSASKN